MARPYTVFAPYLHRICTVFGLKKTDRNRLCEIIYRPSAETISLIAIFFLSAPNMPPPHATGQTSPIHDKNNGFI